MATKIQLKEYNWFIDDIYSNIEEKVFSHSDLGMKEIQSIINDKKWILNPDKYEKFLDMAYTSNFLDYNKDLLKTHIDSFLEKYITTITKNIVLKYFYKKIESWNYTNKDINDIFLFINLYFRYKWNIDLYEQTKQLILKWVPKSEINSNIIGTLKEYYKRTNIQNNSIFQNQLIKFLKQKRIKEENNNTKYMGNNYESELISFQSLKEKWTWDFNHIWRWGVEYEQLKEDIIEELIHQYKRKRNFDYNKFIRDLTTVSYRLWKDNKINTTTSLFTNFINELKDNMISKVKNWL